MATIKFEQALTRLEEIVRALEKGDLSLEESLKRFEDGVKLSKTCMKMLEEAERKVEILVTDKKGQTRARPFAISTDRDGSADDARDEDDDEEKSR